MNRRPRDTLERMSEGRELEDKTYIDAYNGRWDHKIFGTILTGIDYRCMHFILVTDEDEDT